MQQQLPIPKLRSKLAHSSLAGIKAPNVLLVKPHPLTILLDIMHQTSRQTVRASPQIAQGKESCSEVLHMSSYSRNLLVPKSVTQCGQKSIWKASKEWVLWWENFPQQTQHLRQLPRQKQQTKLFWFQDSHWLHRVWDVPTWLQEGYKELWIQIIFKSLCLIVIITSFLWCFLVISKLKQIIV